MAMDFTRADPNDVIIALNSTSVNLKAVEDDITRNHLEILYAFLQGNYEQHISLQKSIRDLNQRLLELEKRHEELARKEVEALRICNEVNQTLVSSEKRHEDKIKEFTRELEALQNVVNGHSSSLNTLLSQRR